MLHVTALLSALLGDTDAVYVMESPTSADVDPEIDMDDTETVPPVMDTDPVTWYVVPDLVTSMEYVPLAFSVGVPVT